MAKLTGKVVSVGETGDLITDISTGDLTSVPRDESLSVKCAGHSTSGLFPTEHGQPEMTFVAFEGECGFVRLSLVGDDASRFLGIKAGDEVVLKW